MKDTKYWYVAVALALSALVGCDENSAGGESSQVESTAPDDGEENGARGAAAQATNETASDTVSEAPTSFSAPPPVGTRVRCPVMGNEFTVTAETERSEHEGRHYAFCCAGCKPRFDVNPEEFIGNQG